MALRPEAQKRIDYLRSIYGETLNLPSGDLRRDLTDRRRVVLESGLGTSCRSVGDARDGLMEFVVSTEARKRDGNILRVAGLRWGNFDRNPAGPWCHRYDLLPVSRWVERKLTTINGVPALVMKAQFAPADVNPFAANVRAGYEQGFLAAVSIGWEPLEYEELRSPDGRFGGFDFSDSDVLETSHCLIGMDADALKVATQRGVFTADQAAAFARWREIDREAAYVIGSTDEARADCRAAAADAVAGARICHETGELKEVATAPASLPPEARSGPFSQAAFEVESKLMAKRAPHVRGAVSDAVDVEMDRCAGSLRVLTECLDEMRMHTWSLYYVEGDGQPVVESSTAAMAHRCLRRAMALHGQLGEALGGMRGAIPNPEGPTGDDDEAGTPPAGKPLSEDGTAITMALGAPAHSRIGKKMAMKRLARLVEGWTQVGDGHRAIDEVIREVSDELDAEAERSVDDDPASADDVAVLAELRALIDPGPGDEAPANGDGPPDADDGTASADDAAALAELSALVAGASPAESAAAADGRDLELAELLMGRRSTVNR